jgi:hypothetical protein
MTLRENWRFVLKTAAKTMKKLSAEKMTMGFMPLHPSEKRAMVYRLTMQYRIPCNYKIGEGQSSRIYYALPSYV